MKLKNLSLIVGAIALSLTATIPFVNAQTTSSPLVVAQAPPQKGQFEQRLGLSDTQKSQIESIRRNTRTEMDKILTQEQREQLKTARENRQRGRRAFSSLNLNEEQKTRMREIKQSEKQQIEAILTDEQKQQMQKFREEKRERRQQRNPE